MVDRWKQKTDSSSDVRQRGEHWVVLIVLGLLFGWVHSLLPTSWEVPSTFGVFGIWIPMGRYFLGIFWVYFGYIFYCVKFDYVILLCNFDYRILEHYLELFSNFSKWSHRGKNTAIFNDFEIPKSEYILGISWVSPKRYPVLNTHPKWVFEYSWVYPLWSG